MKNLLLGTALISSAFLFSANAYATSQTTATEQKLKVEVEVKEEKTFSELLEDYNKTDPSHSALFVTSREVNGWRVAGNDGKVVGEVRDVYIDASGNVKYVVTKFNRLRIREDVFMNPAEVQMSNIGNKYQLGLSEEQIETGSENMVKGKLPEAEENSVFTAKDLDRKKLETARGDKLGQVETILFAEDGLSAKALLVKVNFGPVRNKTMAIPFEALTIGIERGRPKVIISSEDAAAILTQATK